MNKLIFSALLLAIAPLSGMNNNSNNEPEDQNTFKRSTEQDKQEEFIFWRFKKFITILPQLINDEISTKGKKKLIEEFRIASQPPDFKQPFDFIEFIVPAIHFSSSFQREDLNTLKLQLEPLIDQAEQECQTHCGCVENAGEEQKRQASQIFLAYRDQLLQLMQNIQNPYEKLMTEQDQEEEFHFWQLKKMIKIFPKLNTKLSDIEKEHICDDLGIPPHRIDQNYPIDARENSFENHLFMKVGKIAEQRFQRKDLNALKEKIEPLLIECDNECTEQCGRSHEASVEQIQLAGQIILDNYRDQILEILKDIKNPYPYRHAFKPFNLLAFNLEKDHELNDYLDQLKEKHTKQEIQTCSVASLKESKKEQEFQKYITAVYQQGPVWPN